MKENVPNEQLKDGAQPSEKCHLCGCTMYIREGKNGKFLDCSNYSNCKGTGKSNNPNRT